MDAVMILQVPRGRKMHVLLVWSALIMLTSIVMVGGDEGVKSNEEENAKAYWERELQSAMPSSIRAMVTPLSPQQVSQLLIQVKYLPNHAATFCNTTHITCVQDKPSQNLPSRKDLRDAPFSATVSPLHHLRSGSNSQLPPLFYRSRGRTDSDSQNLIPFYHGDPKSIPLKHLEGKSSFENDQSDSEPQNLIPFYHSNGAASDSQNLIPFYHGDSKSIPLKHPEEKSSFENDQSGSEPQNLIPFYHSNGAASDSQNLIPFYHSDDGGSKSIPLKHLEGKVSFENDQTDSEPQNLIPFYHSNGADSDSQNLIPFYHSNDGDSEPQNLIPFYHSNGADYDSQNLIPFYHSNDGDSKSIPLKHLEGKSSFENEQSNSEPLNLIPFYHSNGADFDSQNLIPFYHSNGVESDSQNLIPFYHSNNGDSKRVPSKHLEGKSSLENDQSDSKPENLIPFYHSSDGDSKNSPLNHLEGEPKFESLLVINHLQHHKDTSEEARRISSKVEQVTGAAISPSIHKVGYGFREKQVLVAGHKIYVDIARGRREGVDERAFLPRKLATLFPLDNGGSKIASMLGIPRESLMQTIHVCEGKSEHDFLHAEVKACLTSLEDVVEFVTKIMGSSKPIKVYDAFTNASAYKFVGKTFNVLDVETLKKELDEPNVSCHDMDFPFRVFYCHYAKQTRSFAVTLQGEDGSVHQRIVNCHYDTSYWNPNHVAFQDLHFKQGQDEICHWQGRTWMEENGWVFLYA